MAVRLRMTWIPVAVVQMVDLLVAVVQMVDLLVAVVQMGWSKWLTSLWRWSIRLSFLYRWSKWLSSLWRDLLWWNVGNHFATALTVFVPRWVYGTAYRTYNFKFHKFMIFYFMFLSWNNLGRSGIAFVHTPTLPETYTSRFLFICCISTASIV